MTSASNASSGLPRADTAWRRWHAALMPDYNRKATVYWWTVVVLGIGAVALSLAQLSGESAQTWMQVAAGMSIAMGAGLFPVRIPRSKNSFAAGEIFIFLVLLMHGPAAATLAAAGESAVGAWRTSKRWTSRIASPAMSALAMCSAATVFDAANATLHSAGVFNDGFLVATSMLFAALYFVVNAVLATALPLLKRNERLLWSHLMGLMGWIGFAYAGSAAVAALLFLAYRQSGWGVLLAVVPLLGALLAAFHYYNRQVEAQAAAREAADEAAAREARAAAQAAIREAELAARHLRDLQASERRFHSAFTHASIGMALLSFDGRILQANAALQTLLGAEDARLRQCLFRDHVDEADRAGLDAQLAHAGDEGFDNFALELRCRHRDGDTVWVALHCSHFSEPGSVTPCLILQVQDISARRRAEEGLQELAFNDTLTGLPNRRRFQDHLAQAVSRACTDPAQRFAVLFLDFDRFKLINDSLGHGAGDQFLVQVAQRIKGRLRPHDIVARLGGDEFAVLMQRFHDDDAVVTLADRLLHALREPFRIADTEWITSASIGITTSALGYVDPDSVLRDADIAMYRAKAAGKARYAVFDRSLHAEVSNRLRLEADLRHAIALGQLAVVYQPLVELDGNRLVGFEALARWTHPEQGPIGPDVFIPVAEESGLIVGLTDLVLKRACEQLRQWQLIDESFADLRMQVNLSGRDVAQAGLTGRISHALLGAGLQAQHLTLELTENILMERLETALPMLEELRALGVRLSVDDFGTGYSSLAHLSTLPIDSLKVDRSFVRNLSAGSKEAMVVRGIVQLGQSLGKDVVAEGIETASQFDQLREMGCRLGQGFHMARPLSAERITALLVGQQPWNPGVALPVALNPLATQLH
jgi:diguanylate cyclase (GGDEF)-like protein/PAS domain S-box-containing protein